MWPMDQLFQTVTGGEGDIRNEEIRTGIQLLRMLATSDRTKTPSRLGNKVSKPLMEKKRRARINKCLDQLKSLLESYYTNNIRKRKLEKADILELTVKHLRNLQKRQDCTREFSEYQAGFSSCLASVHQYLLGTDVNGSDRWMLSQLNKNLCGGKQAESYSTLDSDPSTVDTQAALTQRLSAPTSVGAELRKATSTARGDRCLRTLKPLMPRKRLCIGTKRSVVATHSLDNSASVFPSGQCRNHTVNTQVNVWRPW